MIELTEDQQDILAEVFNLGMGKSISALSHLSGEGREIQFDLPKMQVVEVEEFIKRFESSDEKSFVVQHYTGDVSGSAIMFYPGSKNSKLASLLVGSDLALEEMNKLESDALVEIGNIFINAALSCLADFLDVEIHTQIPELLFQDSITTDLLNGNVAIEIVANFRIDHLDINGDVAFVINNNTFDKLIETIDKNL
jgi:chemotaxis protein CheC